MPQSRKPSRELHEAWQDFTPLMFISTPPAETLGCKKRDTRLAYLADEKRAAHWNRTIIETAGRYREQVVGN